MRGVRLVSVTAVATATCALWALPASAATAATHAVTKHPSTTTVSASPTSAWVGASVKLSAKVKTSGRIPKGTVTFKWAGRTLCAGLLAGGSASCKTTFGARGNYAIKGIYSGDATHAGSAGSATVSVSRSATTTTITDPNPSSIHLGRSFTFHVVVATLAGTPAASGTVVVAPYLPPNPPPGYSCVAVVKNGAGTCTVTPAEFGLDDYKATYAGNAAHTGSVSPGGFALATQNVTTTAVSASSTAVSAVTLNGLVHANGANITEAMHGTGSVAFYLSNTQGSTGTVITGCAGVPLTAFTGGPNFDNVAACTSNAELNALKAGTYYITAVFSGDPVNTASTSTQFTLILA